MSMQQKDWLVVGGMVVAILIAFVGWSKPAQIIDATKVDVNAIARSVYDAVIAAQPFGASPGPDRFNVCESRDGIQQCFKRIALGTATTTPCNIQSPGATSTLTRTSLKVTTASSTATTWAVAKAASPNATTTPLRADTALASGVLGTITYVGTSTTGIADPAVFEPNQWLVWSVAGMVSPLAGDTAKLNGICQATFEVI